MGWLDRGEVEELDVKIKLVPFTGADIDRLIGWISSSELLLQWGGSGFRFPLDRNQLKDHLAHAASANPDRFIYSATDARTGQVMGHGEILGIDRQNRSATLGRILVGPPDARGKGIGEQIVRELLRIAFQELFLHRVALRVCDFNRPAIRCYRKVGFKSEGLLRDVHRLRNQYWSVHIMSILEDEWRRESL
jgi:RimJ/RimL family protein N-acetyltransferase